MDESRSLSRRNFLRRLATSGLMAVLSSSGCALRQTPAPSRPTTAPLSSTRSPTPSPPGAASLTAAKITLQFWTEWRGLTAQTWEKLMKRFNQEHPTITIASSYFTLADLQEKTIAAVTAGHPPDLWLNAALILPEFIVDGAVVSISQLPSLPTDFYPAADPASVRDGQRWGVPNNGGVPVLWYNEELFRLAGLDPAQPPQTWDDLVKVGKALTVPAQNQWGFIVPNRHYPWTTECWYGFLLEAGGDIFAPDGRTIAFNAAPGVEALTFWANLFGVDQTAPRQVFDADTLVSTYRGGTIGMFPMYSVETNEIASFSFRSRNTPYPKHVQRGAHFAGNYTTIAAKSKNRPAAFTWCEWWWQPEINATWCAETGALPSRISSTNHPIYQAYLQREPLAKASLDSL
ncbi:MAG TPA: extracellular solute-binding protein, partial [Chloroflexota bacterium]|nr:extracellular solute-binding protein [Chloroflexota bacterium]